MARNSSPPASAKQKAERMGQIMESAERLFEMGSYHGITLATIATELGWSRGNPKAPTKEPSLLAVITGSGEAACRRPDSVFVIPIRTLEI